MIEHEIDWYFCSAAIRIDSKKNEQRHQTLAGKLQNSYFGCMQRISLVMERVST
jgi:hypothetical protein